MALQSGLTFEAVLLCVVLLQVPTLEEMKAGFLGALRGHPEKCKLLQCKIESVLAERGHQWLWTPPYSPKLQPIELFWAAGKNHVAHEYFEGRTMRECVRQLRAGWYGDGGNKQACRCKELVLTANRHANELIQKLDGISGTLDALTVHAGCSLATPVEANTVDMIVNVNEQATMHEDGLPEEVERDAEAEDDANETLHDDDGDIFAT